MHYAKKAIPPGAKRPRGVRLFCVLFVSIPSDVYRVPVLQKRRLLVWEPKMSGLNSIYEQAFKRRKKESEQHKHRISSSSRSSSTKKRPVGLPKNTDKRPGGRQNTKSEKRSPRGVLYGRGAIFCFKKKTQRPGANSRFLVSKNDFFWGGRSQRILWYTTP